MGGITRETERLLLLYASKRDNIRQLVANEVVPSVTAALNGFAALDAMLAEGGELNALAPYHEELMVSLEIPINNLLAAAQALMTAIYVVESEAPGTFGVEVPQ